MSENAFIGKKDKPSQAELGAALGPAKAVWDQLLAELADEAEVTIHEWKCYSLKSGWSLRAMRGSRTVLWLSPRANCFGVIFIFGAKAVSAVQESGLPKGIIKALSEAPKYPEGTGLRLEVKSPREIKVLKKLAALKLAN
jgi:hypothetical protein